MVVIEHAAL